MKKVILNLICVILITVQAVSYVTAAEQEGYNAYAVNEEFYVKTAMSLVDEIRNRINEYHIAELYTSVEDVIQTVENIGQEFGREWNEMYITHFDSAEMFAEVWEIYGIGQTEISDEIESELISDHSVSEMLRNAALQKGDVNQTAAFTITKFEKMLITEDIPNETVMFLISQSSDYCCMVSFYKIAENIMIASAQPMAENQINYAMYHLTSKGCTLNEVQPCTDKEVNQSCAVDSSDLTEDEMMEKSKEVALKLLNRLKSDEYLTAVGVQNMVSDLCLEINEDFANGIGVPAVYKISTALVWDIMFNLSDQGDVEIPEEYVSAVENMKSMPVAETLAGQYISTEQIELLILDSTVGAYAYEIKNSEAGEETLVIYPGGEKYSVLVIINSADNGIVTYTAEIVPAGIEVMFEQLSTGNLEFVK